MIIARAGRPAMSFFFLMRSLSPQTTIRPIALSKQPVRRTALSATRSSVKLGFYLRSVFYRCLRLRLERFLFNQTYCRTYVYFKNILSLTLYQFHFWVASERSFLRYASQRGGRALVISEVFSLVLIRAIGFMFSVVGGLFFFTRLFGAMVQKFRRQWALMQYVNQLLSLVRLGFWYHAHIQYRFSMLGRFSGVMRAAKKVLGHGSLKLYLWRGVLDYTQVDIPTKWGIFGFSFWLQFRDIPQLRIGRFMQRYRKILRAMVLGLATKATSGALPQGAPYGLDRFGSSRRTFSEFQAQGFQKTIGTRRHPTVAKSISRVLVSISRLKRSTSLKPLASHMLVSGASRFSTPRPHAHLRGFILRRFAAAQRIRFVRIKSTRRRYATYMRRLQKRLRTGRFDSKGLGIEHKWYLKRSVFKRMRRAFKKIRRGARRWDSNRLLRFDYGQV